MSRFVALLLLLFGFSPCFGEGDTKEFDYLSKRINAYEHAIERCESMAASRPLPDESLLESLRKHDLETLRAFLITRSVLVTEQCQKPELTELAYAIGVLEEAQVAGKVDDLIKVTKPVLFEKSTWELKSRYFDVPKETRHELEKIPYFSQPFSDIDVIEALK